MKAILLLAVICLCAGTLQAQPIILPSDDVQENYYDKVPAGLAGDKNWLGLFITSPETDGKRFISRLQVTEVAFLQEKEGAVPIIYRIATKPVGAVMLFSGVPHLSAGPAVTVGRNITLWDRKREVTVTLGKLQYTIRWESSQPDYCDSTVSIVLGKQTQQLYSVELAVSKSPTTYSCDQPHFRIHWAGDIDRDGRLDMVATFSRKYSYFPRQLFLSSVAQSPHLVAEVVRYERWAE